MKNGGRLLNTHARAKFWRPREEETREPCTGSKVGIGMGLRRPRLGRKISAKSGKRCNKVYSFAEIVVAPRAVMHSQANRMAGMLGKRVKYGMARFALD
jgi:hypothetical protein